MRETFRERDIVAPTKIELLCGLGCWLLYLSGIPELLRWLLPLLGVDLSSVRGASLAQIAAFVLDFILLVLVFHRSARICLLLAAGVSRLAADYVPQRRNECNARKPQ